jgi:hypothetical protein
MPEKKKFNFKKEHKSEKGGLTEKGRKAYNAATGSNLKAPQPEGGARKKSYCARRTIIILTAQRLLKREFAKHVKDGSVNILNFEI